VVEKDSRHAGAVRLVGLLALQGGRREEAVEWLRRGVGLAPQSGQLWNDLGGALGAAGKVAEALGAFRKAYELEPGNGDVACNLGMALVQGGAFEEAVGVLGWAVTLRPGDGQMWTALGDARRELGLWGEALVAYQSATKLDGKNAHLWLRMGLALKALGRVEEALEAYRRAGELAPGLAEAHFNAGNALRELKRLPEAVEAYGRAMGARPGYADAAHNLGTVFEEQKRWEEATVAFGEATRLRPDFQPAWRGLGKALLSMKRPEEAVAALRRAVALDPNSSEAISSLADAVQKVGGEREALALYRRAAELRPDDATVLVNWGGLLEKMRDSQGAIGKYRRALELRPDYGEAKYNLALSLLRLGEFAEGWEAYEARWQVLERNYDKRELREPVWAGEDVRGKRVLVHLEQGYGDAIQFARYLPMLAGRGAKVMVRCDESLRRLFEESLPLGRVLGVSEPLPEFDFQVALLSLPRIFGTTLETIPADVPYLKASGEAVGKWRERVDRSSGELRVGLAWAGNPIHEADRARSISLAAIAPLAAVANVRWFGLQVGEARKQITEAAALGMGVTDLGEELNDFADTAAAMMNLDLVISVDTAVAHLAGALGRPVWVMLRHGAEWRWMEGRKNSPWYPTMRVFMQERAGEWGGVVEEVGRELKIRMTKSSDE
jgi:tetratricopeptide (TPR) repeat protein